MPSKFDRGELQQQLPIPERQAVYVQQDHCQGNAADSEHYKTLDSPIVCFVVGIHSHTVGS